MVRRRRIVLATLFVAVTALGVAAAFGSAGDEHPPRASVVRPRLVRPPGVLPGYLLIADRGNNRILLVDARKRVLWAYPRPHQHLAMPFRFDDDTFFGPGFTRIISNQEDQDTIQVISFPRGRLLWRYGHPNVRGIAPGYLNTPDDAYLLPNGLRSVADAYNCRVLFISAAGRIVRQIGTDGSCAHAPPRSLGPVNGATPLHDGGVLISETTGSWIDDVGPRGRLRWSVRAPVSYPSDPQLLGSRILLADYSRPGQAIVMTKRGRVVWRYGPRSGPGELDHPSLAARISKRLIAINDDFRDRVVVVDMRTRRIVWQFGHTDRSGRRVGFLNTPDGLDLLPFRDAWRIPALRRLVGLRARGG
jgi:outer membrane protein assembly factor BamB